MTGVNGIRKTTSIYQPWFPQLLQEALIAPDDDKMLDPPALETLPVGSNSFFRQLDHMIATLCNEDFCKLYFLTQEEAKAAAAGSTSSSLIKRYSNLKAAIFGRYRTLSELLGAWLVGQTKLRGMNCMMETSGRDVAMFHYVDHFFSDKNTNKLALHFTINSLDQAKESVDARMVTEMKKGIAAIEKEDVHDIINANLGGPYGSEVLEGIQQESDRVWKNKYWAMGVKLATIGTRLPLPLPRIQPSLGRHKQFGQTAAWVRSLPFRGHKQ